MRCMLCVILLFVCPLWCVEICSISLANAGSDRETHTFRFFSSSSTSFCFLLLPYLCLYFCFAVVAQRGPASSPVIPCEQSTRVHFGAVVDGLSASMLHSRGYKLSCTNTCVTRAYIYLTLSLPNVTWLSVRFLPPSRSA